MTSLDWKRFYAAEREGVLKPALDWWLELDAPALPERGFIVFPHTRLMRSVEQVVPAALAVLNARVTEVVALGPLHGGPRRDAELVQRARTGDELAIREVRGLHSGDSELAEEEFCLDTFEWLLDQLARRLERPPPRVQRRHPFLTGEDATTLPGFRRLKDLVDRGAAVVATGDLIHHGAGYHTQPAEQRSRLGEETRQWASAEILQGMEFLAQGDFLGYFAHAGKVKNDFRDVGPVLRALLPGPWKVELNSLALVGYEDVLKTPPPTWVSSALLTVSA